MGLPAGHLTDPAIGITINAQLKACGNGVCPQQAAEATRRWLERVAGHRRLVEEMRAEDLEEAVLG